MDGEIVRRRVGWIDEYMDGQMDGSWNNWNTRVHLI